MRTKKFWLIFFIFSVLPVLLIGFFLFRQEMAQQKQAAGRELPILGQIQEFTLYDTAAQEFNSSQHLQGKIWVADFIFTTCGGICPMMTKNMKEIYRAYPSVEQLKFVSITVNPEYDSPQVLADYAQQQGVNPEQWYFLTGARETIQNLAVESFKLGSVEEPVFHSGYLVLMDGEFRIRGYYDGTQQENIEKIKADINVLLQKKP